MKIRPLLLLAGCLAFAAATASAQNVNVTFRTYGMGRGTANSVLSKLYYKTGNKYSPLGVGAGQVSQEPVSYAGPSTMQFFIEGRPTVRAGSSTSESYTAVGSVTFPGNGNYVVAIYAPEGGGNVAFAVKDSAVDFPAGSLRVLNATKYPLAIECGEAKFDVKPGTSLIGKPKPIGQGTFRAFNLDNKRSEVVIETVPLSATGRLSAFVVLANAAAVAADPNVTPQFVMTSYTDAAPSNARGPSTGGNGNGNRSNTNNRPNSGTGSNSGNRQRSGNN